MQHKMYIYVNKYIPATQSKYMRWAFRVSIICTAVSENIIDASGLPCSKHQQNIESVSCSIEVRKRT